MSIVCASLTVRVQPSPRFHVEAWLPFRNCEIDIFGGRFFKHLLGMKTKGSDLSPGPV